VNSTFFTDRDLGKAFPAILREAGILVERHADHFVPMEQDEVWLEEVGRRGWVALTHDHRIRYEPNELAAVVRAKVRLLVLVGAAPTRELAQNFVNSIGRIEKFLEGRLPPFIAKVYRPTPQEILRRAAAPGRVEQWYP